MDRVSLIERLRGIEWDDFEVKEASGGIPQTAYTTVSAFANSKGGWLVFGVAESKEGYKVTGVFDPDSMQNDFLGVCRSSEKFSRPVEVRPRQFSFDEKIVLAFYIAPSRRFDKPIRVRMKKSWHAYVRVGARDERCSPEEEARFLRDASAETFDALTMPEAGVDDLDQASLSWVQGLLVQRYPTREFAGLSPALLLDELGLLREGKLIHAAVLLFGKDKLIARIKPGGLLDFRWFRAPWTVDVPAHRYDNRTLYEQNIVLTLRSMLDGFGQLLPQAFALEAETMQRQAHPPEFPALRESLVNLLIHQDYADQHRTSRVLWFQDRLLFENPGDSFVLVEDMLDGGSSDLRNPRIARVLRQIGFAEQAGTGIPTIVRTWRDVERVPPEIENMPGTKTYELSLFWSHRPIRDRAGFQEHFGVEIDADAMQVLEWLSHVGQGERGLARLATGKGARVTSDIVEELLAAELVEICGDDLGRLRLSVPTADWFASSHSLVERQPNIPRPEEGVRHVATPDTGTKKGPSRDQAGTKQGPSRDQVGTKPANELGPSAGSALSEVQRLVLEAAQEAQSASSLMALVGRRHRTKFRDTVLRPLMEAGLLVQTLPGKPKSPQQRYLLTEGGRALLSGSRVG